MDSALELPLADEFDQPGPPRLEITAFAPAQAAALPDLLGEPHGPLLREWVEGRLPMRAVSAFSYSLPLVSNLESALHDAVPSIHLERSAPPQWTMDSFLPLFQQRTFTERQKFFLMRLGHQLPSSTHPFYVTSLGEEGLRFRTVGWSRKGLLGFLQGFSLSQLADDISSLLPLWASGAQRMVTLDFGAEDFLPRLQMACAFDRQPASEPGWQALGEELIERELAAPEAVEAMLDWPRAPEGEDARAREIDRVQWRLSTETAPESWTVLSIRRQGNPSP
ncbi:MAG: hypothetical protein AAF772_00335 [Acidobacteriota bacterium]